MFLKNRKKRRSASFKMFICKIINIWNWSYHAPYIYYTPFLVDISVIFISQSLVVIIQANGKFIASKTPLDSPFTQNSKSKCSSNMIPIATDHTSEVIRILYWIFICTPPYTFIISPPPDQTAAPRKQRKAIYGLQMMNGYSVE